MLRGQLAVLTFSKDAKTYWIFLGGVLGVPLGSGRTEQEAFKKSLDLLPVNRPHSELSIGASRTEADIPKLMNHVNAQPQPQSKPEFQFVNEVIV